MRARSLYSELKRDERCILNSDSNLSDPEENDGYETRIIW
jgi:hypothetical protein